MAQINRAAAVSQWGECLNVGEDRAAIKMAYSRLNQDEQLAYLPENGNVAPVVLDLRRERDARVDRNQNILDELDIVKDSFSSFEDKTRAHERVNAAFQDREEQKKVQQLYRDTLKRLKEQCTEEIGLDTFAEPAPFEFRPLPSSNVAEIFQRVSELGEITPTDDGGYTPGDVEKVLVGLVNRLDHAVSSNSTYEANVVTLTERLRLANDDIEAKQKAITTVTKEKERFETSATERLTANYTLQQRFNAIEMERDELLVVMEQKKSLEAELEIAKEARTAVEGKYSLLESTSSGDAQELAQAKRQLEESRKDVYQLEVEKVAADAEFEQLNSAMDELQRENDEMQREWEEELQRLTSKVEVESEGHRQQAERLAGELDLSRVNWSRALTEVLASTVTGQNIEPELLQPILTPALSQIHTFNPQESPAYCFARSYIRPTPAPETTPEDITIIDLLRWSKNIATPPGFTSDDLDQLIWLESHLLESIRKREKQGSPVLLAFELLFHKVKSNDWLARCISCVRLAVLGDQYVMQGTEIWSRLVGELRVSYPQLDVDPLAQACVARLALTTSDPASHMKQTLADAFQEGLFSKTTPIPGIVALLHDDGVVSGTFGEIQLVMVRFQHLEVVFSRYKGYGPWECSLQPIKVKALDLRLKLTWGPSPEHTVTFRYTGTALYAYLHRYHGTTTIAAASAEKRKRTTDLVNAALNRPATRSRHAMD